jgi:hypothetical protein
MSSGPGRGGDLGGEVGLPALLGQHRLVERAAVGRGEQGAHPAEQLQVEVEDLAVAAHERARQQPSHGPGKPEQEPERPPQAPAHAPCARSKRPPPARYRRTCGTWLRLFRFGTGALR